MEPGSDDSLSSLSEFDTEDEEVDIDSPFSIQSSESEQNVISAQQNVSSFLQSSSSILDSQTICQKCNNIINVSQLKFEKLITNDQICELCKNLPSKLEKPKGKRIYSSSDESSISSDEEQMQQNKPIQESDNSSSSTKNEDLDIACPKKPIILLKSKKPKSSKKTFVYHSSDDTDAVDLAFADSGSSDFEATLDVSDYESDWDSGKGKKASNQNKNSKTNRKTRRSIPAKSKGSRSLNKKQDQHQQPNRHANAEKPTILKIKALTSVKPHQSDSSASVISEKGTSKPESNSIHDAEYDDTRDTEKSELDLSENLGKNAQSKGKTPNLNSGTSDSQNSSSTIHLVKKPQTVQQHKPTITPNKISLDKSPSFSTQKSFKPPKLVKNVSLTSPKVFKCPSFSSAEQANCPKQALSSQILPSSPPHTSVKHCNSTVLPAKSPPPLLKKTSLLSSPSTTPSSKLAGFSRPPTINNNPISTTTSTGIRRVGLSRKFASSKIKSSSLHPYLKQ
ncbi:hypothetical protein AYI70_g472 [Smittium culicis]|uniref:RAD51 interacting motif domain-containing protein n=1 Tax=Smittium culicis TaxID=133412 RepID=A0A1R1YGK4_9FUNG|nr:hypothetical protein AYI70_g472 [Smittium culicis]